MDRFETIPGIDSIGWVSSRPLAEFDGFSNFVIDGKENSGPDELPSTTVTTGTQGAFDVLQIPLVRGRGLAPTDNAGGLPIALVNEDMVERYWDGEDPIGGRVRIGGYQSEAPWLTVVGVIGNIYSGNPEQPSFPQMIVPLRQNVTPNLGLLVRPVDGGDPLALVADIRREVAAVDADQPLGDVSA